MRTTRLPFSAGSGDAAADDAFDHELREEQEGQWYRTTREQLPYLSDCSYSDTDTELSDVIMDEGWPYDADIDEMPMYAIGLTDYYEEDLLLSTFEQQQDMEEYIGDMDLLREREEEWPEAMRRQYDEDPETAHRRHHILELVRHFLHN